MIPLLSRYLNITYGETLFLWDAEAWLIYSTAPQKPMAFENSPDWRAQVLHECRVSIYLRIFLFHLAMMFSGNF